MSSGFNWVKKTVCEESSLPPDDFCDASYSPTETPPTYFPTTSPRPSETSTDRPTVTGCEINSGGKMHFVDPAEDSDVHDIVGGTEVRQLCTQHRSFISSMSNFLTRSTSTYLIRPRLGVIRTL